MHEPAKPRLPRRDFAVAPDPSGAVFEKWRADLSALFEISLPAGADAAAFTIQGAQWRLPGVIVEAEIGSALIRDRSPGMIARHPADQVVLYLLRAGKTTHICDGRRLEMRSGDVAIFDYMRPIKTVASPFSSVTLAFNRGRAPAFMRNGALHGTALSAENGATRLIAGQLQTLVDVLDDLSPDEAGAAVESLLAIAEAAWRRIDAEAQADIALRDRATAAIKAKIGKSTLTPGALANTLGISRARLSRLFAPEGGVGALILKLRLDACLKELTEEPGPGRILTVALRYRFSGEASFSRAFRKHFGVTPRQALALGAAKPAGAASIDGRKAQADAIGLGTVG
jgi:AraC-like DNA-binding protein